MYQSFLSLQSFHKIVLTLPNVLFFLMIFKIFTLRESYVTFCHDPHIGTQAVFTTPGHNPSNDLECGEFRGNPPQIRWALPANVDLARRHSAGRFSCLIFDPETLLLQMFGNTSFPFIAKRNRRFLTWNTCFSNLSPSFGRHTALLRELCTEGGLLTFPLL